jgi:hypothetical protein
MSEIKDEVQQGRYRVDARAVADAIMRHVLVLAIANTDPMRAAASRSRALDQGAAG